MEHLKIDFDKLEINQKVYDIVYGEGRIIALTNDKAYPILISYPYTTNRSFTKEGKYDRKHLNPSLFLSNPFEQVNEYPKLMEVSDTHSNLKQHTIEEIIAYLPEREYPYISKRSVWKYAKEIQKPQIYELTLKDIADKFGVSVDSIRIKE